MIKVKLTKKLMAYETEVVGISIGKKKYVIYLYKKLFYNSSVYLHILNF